MCRLPMSAQTSMWAILRDGGERIVHRLPLLNFQTCAEIDELDNTRRIDPLYPENMSSNEVLVVANCHQAQGQNDMMILRIY